MRAALLGALLAFPTDDALLAAGRTLTEAFEAGELAQVARRFSAELRASVSEGALVELRGSARESYGERLAVLGEAILPRAPWRVYERRALHERAVVLIEWAFGENGEVEGIALRLADSEAPTARADYATRATLRLPFEGEWFVYWGGRRLDDNAHAARPDQRFATDFLIARKGRSYRGDGARNDDYLAFGQPVVAPAAATVVRAVDGIPDNAPGVSNARGGLGNHVVLDLGSGEVALLGHIQNGSIVVRTGDQVVAGQPLARCGNSGASAEPILHFHLQTSDAEAGGEGLPAQFAGYSANGRPVARGEPRKGQLVRATSR